MRAAIVRDGIVENIIIAGKGFEPGYGAQLVSIGDDPVSVGAVYDGKTFTNPESEPSIVPMSISMRQGRLALLAAGLLDIVEDGIASIPDPLQRRAAQIEWEYATEIQRKSQLIFSLGPALGLTEAQIDDVFIAASAIT